MKKIFFLISFCVLCFVGFGQQESDTVFQIKKGKKYILHIALKENTLWGMHKMYAVPVNDIVAANPGIDNGVKEGNAYLIPAGSSDLKVEDGKDVIWHKVLKGETLFGLLKKYGTTEAELKKINPTLGSGLKVGQMIWIPRNTVNVIVTPKVENNNSGTDAVLVKTPTVQVPKTTVSFTDSVISYTVKPKETMYTISKRFMVPVADLLSFNNLKSTKLKVGTALKIPLKKENFVKIEVRAVEPLKNISNESPEKKINQEFIFTPKSNYKIAVLLPFHLSETSNSSIKTLSTEFYMGAKLAIDSLGKLGLKATFDVIDFPQDSLSIINYLAKAEMKNYDLIFGPLISNEARIVAKWCKENQIRMVCPAQVNETLLENNQFVYTAVSSDEVLMKKLAKYTIRNLGKSQIILVNSGNTKDQQMYNAYREAFLSESSKNGNVKLIEAKFSDYATYLRKNMNNTVVFPSTDKVSSVKFVSSVSKNNSRVGAGTITILGTKDWSSFDDITASMRNEFHITWAANNDMNYKSESMKDFLRKYRVIYKADVNKYAVQGYDVIMHYASFLLLEKDARYLVSNVFSDHQIGVGSGYENHGVLIIENNNFDLKRVFQFESE